MLDWKETFIFLLAFLFYFATAKILQWLGSSSSTYELFGLFALVNTVQNESKLNKLFRNSI